MKFYIVLAKTDLGNGDKMLKIYNVLSKSPQEAKRTVSSYPFVDSVEAVKREKITDEDKAYMKDVLQFFGIDEYGLTKELFYKLIDTLE